MPYKNPEDLRAARNRYYQRNKDQVKEAARDRRNKIVRLIQEYKQSRPCTDCGIDYPYWIMELDHLPGFEKVANVSKMARNFSADQVREELKKCEVVCANCHKDRTHARLVKNTGGMPPLEG